VVSDLNESLSGNQNVNTRSIHRSCMVPLGYEVEEEEQPVLVADHVVVGMTVLALRLDHLLAEVGVHNEDQGLKASTLKS